MKIKIGRINFINCKPINYALAKFAESGSTLFNASEDLEKHEIEFFDCYPSEVNKKLRSGEIDVAPISSFEYLANKDKYELLGNLSISSKKQADSVLFFSKKPIPELKKIYVTNKSASSVALLKVILAKKYKLEDLEFEVFEGDHFDLENKLLIGDEALQEAKASDLYILDLGEEWFNMTSLPMVFGVWAYNKNFSMTDSIKELFYACKEQGFNEFYPDVLVECFTQTGLPKVNLERYFRHLDYEFTEKHRDSLDLFEAYAQGLGLLDPEIVHA